MRTRLHSAPVVVANPVLFPVAVEGVDMGSGANGTAEKIVLPHPGRCPERPVHTIFVCDNSGSVTNGNDTIGRRYEEASIAIERVGKYCRCKNEIVSIIHFDTPTSSDIRAARISAGVKGQIERGLTIPPDGAGISELSPSLCVAHERVAQYPRHLPVLVALTDFELFDADVERTLVDLCAFPGLVFAVVLRAEPPTQLLADDRANVARVTYDSPRGVVARAVFQALTAGRRSTRRSTKPSAR